MQRLLFLLVVVGAGVLVGGIGINRAVPSSPTASTDAVVTVLSASEPFVGAGLLIVAALLMLTVINGVTA